MFNRNELAKPIGVCHFYWSSNNLIEDEMDPVILTLLRSNHEHIYIYKYNIDIYCGQNKYLARKKIAMIFYWIDNFI